MDAPKVIFSTNGYKRVLVIKYEDDIFAVETKEGNNYRQTIFIDKEEAEELYNALGEALSIDEPIHSDDGFDWSDNPECSLEMQKRGERDFPRTCEVHGLLGCTNTGMLDDQRDYAEEAYNKRLMYEE